MNRLYKIIFFVIFVGASLFCINARADHEYSSGIEIYEVADFYEPLAPFGYWIEIEPYGLCWQPTKIAEDWRPYSNGHWLWSDSGWYWVSEEPWAWVHSANLSLKQDESQAVYAKKLTKEDGRIDWNRPATSIERQIRAMDPWPSAYTNLGDLLLKVWKAEVVSAASGKAGELLPDHIIATGEGGLKIRELQPAGKKRMSLDAFLQGHKLAVGSFLG